MLPFLSEETAQSWHFKTDDVPSVTYLFTYLHLFFCHTITYSIFNLQWSPPQAWWGWSNPVREMPCSLSTPHPKTTTFLLFACPLRNFCSLAAVQLWLINSNAPALFLTQKRFFKSAIYTIRIGKEEGMFTAFNPFSAVKEETKKTAAFLCCYWSTMYP